MISSESWDGAVAITPSNTTAQFNSPAAGFVVGAAGNVNLVTARGQSVVVPAAAGVPIRLAFTWIKSTNTTATTIVALTNAQFKGDT